MWGGGGGKYKKLESLVLLAVSINSSKYWSVKDFMYVISLQVKH